MKKQSFQQIFQQYEKLIKSQIKALRIYKNFDEFYQVGLIALWKAYKNYDEKKGTFSAYAYITVRGNLLQHLRQEAIYDEHFEVNSEKLEDHHGHAYQHDEPLAKDIFHSYLTTLTERQKTWTIEAIYYGKTISDIAKQYGVSTEAVKSWRKEALKKLRNHPNLAKMKKALHDRDGASANAIRNDKQASAKRR